MIYTVTLNTAIDKIIHLEGTLTRKKNNKINYHTYDIGGKATHVSVVLSTLNIPNIATGFVGMENKDKLYAMLEEKQVTCAFVEQANARTRETLVLIDASGKGSYMITDTGFTINETSQKKLIRKLKEVVKADDIVVFAGSPPKGLRLEGYLSIVNAVRGVGAKIVMDVNGYYLKHVIGLKPYVIKPNEDEFQELIGKSLDTLEEYKQEIINLLNLGIKYVFVSLGEKGSLIGHDKKIYKVTPPKVEEVNDTGCGDVFVGGIVAGIYNELPIEGILRLATALSASKASQKESSSFSLEQTEQLKKEIKIEELSIQGGLVN